MDVLFDVTFPRTDAGVFAQLALLVALCGTALWFVRTNRELRLFVIGVFVFTFALMGLRTLH